MNILVVNYEYPPIGAGAASASWQMAKELATAGHFVGVLTSSFGELRGETKEGYVHIYRCKSIRKKQFQSNVIEMAAFMVSASFAVGKLIRKWKIDHLIVFFSIPGGPVGLAAKLFYNKPYVVSLRGSDVPGAEPGLQAFHFILKPLRRLILHKSIAVVVNSSSLMQLAYKSDPRDYIVIPNGVDTEYYCPAPQNRVNPELTQFLYVGRLQRQKNLFFLFDCIRELKSKTNKPFLFNIAGDGPIRRELETYATRLNITENIFFHGWVEKSKVLLLYQQSDVIVNMSFNEGMSNVLLEAMACGLPAIATNVSGNNVLVENKSTGYLFELNNTAELLAILLSVVEAPEEIKFMGATARKKVIEKYSWESVSSSYVSLLRQPKEE